MKYFIIGTKKVQVFVTVMNQIKMGHVESVIDGLDEKNVQKVHKAALKGHFAVMMISEDMKGCNKECESGQKCPNEEANRVFVSITGNEDEESGVFIPQEIKEGDEINAPKICGRPDRNTM